MTEKFDFEQQLLIGEEAGEEEEDEADEDAIEMQWAGVKYADKVFGKEVRIGDHSRNKVSLTLSCYPCHCY